MFWPVLAAVQRVRAATERTVVRLTDFRTAVAVVVGAADRQLRRLALQPIMVRLVALALLAPLAVLAVLLVRLMAELAQMARAAAAVTVRLHGRLPDKVRAALAVQARLWPVALLGLAAVVVPVELAVAQPQQARAATAAITVPVVDRQATTTRSTATLVPALPVARVPRA